MTGGRTAALAWWSALTILVSAFLLFQVQPVISKKILPWFGGSPAVWTTAMLFFQVVLLGGYAYAHLLIRYVPAAKQGVVHALLLIVALASLPITPTDFWKPNDGSQPALRILLLLLAKVGPTYFLLAATGPLVQAWFSRAYPGRSPYRLYALSNIGSLAALLSYPFVFETLLAVDQQGKFWSLGFIGFAVLIGGLAWAMWRMAALPAEEKAATQPHPTLVVDDTADSTPLPTGMRIVWICLAALASMALLAITNHVCQDIAVVPFMWVAPLSLYLLSFIICFDSERWYVRKFWGLAAVLGILLLCGLNNLFEVDNFLTWVQKPLASLSDTALFKFLAIPITFSDVMDGLFGLISKLAAIIDKPVQAMFNPPWNVKFSFRTADYGDNPVAQGIAYVSVLFFICMVCHGELVKFKPKPAHLTIYYLMISTGGALGGLFVALICPLLFHTYFELALAIVGGFIVGWVALANDGRETWLKGREILQWSAAFFIVGGVLLVSKGSIEGVERGAITIRNFYGTLAVKELEDTEETGADGRALYHGRILHGFQYSDPAKEMEPTTYYVPASGAGLSVEQYPRLEGQSLRVAVIGLGTGTMAAYGKPGDVYRFYDIDPKVVTISERYFTFRTKTPAQVDIVLGDARVRMEREPDQNYDVIVLDAFSGDAIPAHLLTVEAIEVYLRHLRKSGPDRPTGIIAVHISNRYLDLKPVVMALARKFAMPARIVHVEEGFQSGDTGSDWVLLTRNQEFWHNPTVEMLATPLTLDDGKKELLWTDQRSSILPLMD